MHYISPHSAHNAHHAYYPSSHPLGSGSLIVWPGWCGLLTLLSAARWHADGTNHDWLWLSAPPQISHKPWLVTWVLSHQLTTNRPPHSWGVHFVWIGRGQLYCEIWGAPSAKPLHFTPFKDNCKQLFCSLNHPAVTLSSKSSWIP